MLAGAVLASEKVNSMFGDPVVSKEDFQKLGSLLERVRPKEEKEGEMICVLSQARKIIDRAIKDMK